MERIEPLADHLFASELAACKELLLDDGKVYAVVRYTTLASGEPALVLRGDTEQFTIGLEELRSQIRTQTG